MCLVTFNSLYENILRLFFLWTFLSFSIHQTILLYYYFLLLLFSMTNISSSLWRDLVDLKVFHVEKWKFQTKWWAWCLRRMRVWIIRRRSFNKGSVGHDTTFKGKSLIFWVGYQLTITLHNCVPIFLLKKKLTMKGIPLTINYRTIILQINKKRKDKNKRTKIAFTIHNCNVRSLPLQMQGKENSNFSRLTRGREESTPTSLKISLLMVKAQNKIKIK